ncbi:hypothetical protein ACH5RR_026448 [Cinchona calisaya]|uniref:NAD(P)H-quinone oxidoreductase subunit M, chloroplastic n=1 Tax=Cinchona calisaya TaxID=153742 RepID=A0ABD2Z4H4_9GENT
MKVEEEREKEKRKQQEQQTEKQPRPVEPQRNVKSKNMSREYGGQWLSSATRHGAELTEYTLRLIIEHFIRKLLYEGEIQYNMKARVLNFSMGKPRIGFNYNDDRIQDANL